MGHKHITDESRASEPRAHDKMSADHTNLDIMQLACFIVSCKLDWLKVLSSVQWIVGLWCKKHHWVNTD